MKQHLAKIAAGFASALIVAAPFAAGALSIDDIQAQIASLLKQVSALQEQIKALQNTETSPPQEDGIWIPKHRICALLNRNLNIGVSGDDVMGLQEYLQSEGYLSAQPTGYFGQLTAQAVAKWQAREGVSSVGTFGPMSRERLKIWCGGSVPNKERFNASPTRGDAPLTVVFDTWLSGFRVNTISYSIDYGDGTTERAADCYAPADWCQSPGQNKHTYSANGTYTATLIKTENPCQGNPMCTAPVSREVVGKVQIQVGAMGCTKEYMPVCGAKQVQCITTPCNPIPTTYGNKCEMANDGATFLYQGQCRTTTTNPEDDPQCKAWFDGCNTCSRGTPGGMAACTMMACIQGFPDGQSPPRPYCKAYFDSTNNKPPVISGLSGPTTLSVNQAGTWTINASDPENQSLSYQVLWGDESNYPAMTTNGAALSDAFVQTTTFTHAYSAAGTYTVVVVAKDAAGAAAKTSTTVRVGSEPIACTMEYAPVCGRPAGCANTCTTGICPAICQLPAPQTYGNRCSLNASGAMFIHTGECTPTSGNWY